jgi:hypothetical protein
MTDQINDKLVEIRYRDSIVKIRYDFDVDLPQILEFEGRRLASLHAREITLPCFEHRTWDTKRLITVSSREKKVD